MEKTRICLACGTVYPEIEEKCPQRWDANHSDMHYRRVITALLRLGWDGESRPHKELVDMALAQVIPG